MVDAAYVAIITWTMMMLVTITNSILSHCQQRLKCLVSSQLPMLAELTADTRAEPLAMTSMSLP